MILFLSLIFHFGQWTKKSAICIATINIFLTYLMENIQRPPGTSSKCFNFFHPKKNMWKLLLAGMSRLCSDIQYTYESKIILLFIHIA